MKESRANLKAFVDGNHPEISIRRQCELLGLNRSNYYYRSEDIDEFHERILRRTDEIFTERPFFGSRRILQQLREEGFTVNRKRIQGIMQELGLETVYPGPNLSKARHEHKKYPYLLRGVEIREPNQVWSSDITYIRMQRGFLYLVAIIDWYSRAVLSWRLSNSLEADFCVEALEEALMRFKNPGIFNTDQGCQFTCDAHVNVLKGAGIQISMDGKGRALDNIFIERLWRSVKYEEVYLRDYVDGRDARESLNRYFTFYNHNRFHQSLGYQTPWAVYTRKCA